MDDLPDEILAEITRVCGLGQIVALSNTSKRLRRYRCLSRSAGPF
jgi:hypothetical protein